MSLPALPPSMRMDIYSHHVKVTNFRLGGKDALLRFCRGLAQFGLVRVGPGRFESRMVRVFVGVTNDRTEFHFHRNQLNDLLVHLDSWGIPREAIETHVHPMYTPPTVEFPLKDLRPPRDIQVGIIDYLVDACMAAIAPSKVVTLQTGKGKSYIALQAVHRLRQRTVIVIKGMYVDKWKSDIENAYHLKKGELLICRGSKDLMALIEQGQADVLEAKFVIVTAKTMANFMKSYEQFKDADMGYHVQPEELYETLGVGIRLIDEVHQEFHCNFRQDLYTHVPRTISLSATLDSDDRFTNAMYDVTWPPGSRAPTVAHDCYIAVTALWYTLEYPERLRWKNAMGQYSHTKFELTLMKQKHMLNNYVQMIVDIVDNSFMEKRAPGQKMLIFCATIEFCTRLRNHLASLYPDLRVNRYCEDDDYEENLLTADIAVSTLLSAGTAVDIPNLRITLMTTALSSKVANLQVLGRTRPLVDWPDVTPEFLFLAAQQIDKHVQYAAEKEQKFHGKVKSFTEQVTHFRV